VTRHLLAALIGLALSAAARAQDKTDPAAKTGHATYVVRHGDPAALADSLAKHFEGHAAVSVLPVGAGNTLLISGTAAATAELAKLLEQADRPARAVEVEVALAEVTLKTGGDGKEAAEPDLTGTGAAVLARLEALARAGSGTLRRVKLTAAEGKPVEATAGGQAPVVTQAVAGGAGGFGGRGGPPLQQRAVSFHPTGATLRVTARVGPDNAVLLDLAVNETRVKPAEPGADAAGTETSSLTTRLTVPSGRAVTAQLSRADGKGGRVVSAVVVTARVTGPADVARR
jgi:type II secretory pathway component HofQ